MLDCFIFVLAVGKKGHCSVKTCKSKLTLLAGYVAVLSISHQHQQSSTSYNNNKCPLHRSSNIFSLLQCSENAFLALSLIYSILICFVFFLS